MSKKSSGGRGYGEEVVDSSSDDEAKPASAILKRKRAGRQPGAGQVPWEPLETVAVFQALMQTTPESPCGMKFAKYLSEEVVPARSADACQSFVSGKLRQKVPRLFESLYKNNLGLLKPRQRVFLMEFMKNHPFFQPFGSKSSENQASSGGPSCSSSTNDIYQPSCSFISGFSQSTPIRPSAAAQQAARPPSPSISPVTLSGTRQSMEEFTESVANVLFKKLQNAACLRQENVSVTLEQKKDIEEEISDDLTLNEVDRSLLKNLETLQAPPSPDYYVDSGIEQALTGKGQHDVVEDQSLSVEEKSELRANISTITLIEIFEKGYKGRDSPFIVTQQGGTFLIRHESSDPLMSSTAGVADYSGNDSAIDSIVKHDIVSVGGVEQGATVHVCADQVKEVKYHLGKFYLADKEDTVSCLLKARGSVVNLE